MNSPVQHVDVIIIGAGLSGIGAACHLTRKTPGKSYLILEGRKAMGGTWDLFRYPGIRSDSDMFTLGYNFKPWTSSQFLADGPSILNYIREAAEEYNVVERIHYNRPVKKISWDSQTATWTINTRIGKSNRTQAFTCNFIIGCTGYYNYEHGYEPEFKGSDSFKGQIIHPQKWPEDLDYTGKNVVVIGSGATAVTVVPEMARDAAHVTMLQRSPTYMAAVPARNKMVDNLRKFLPEEAVYRITRTHNIGFQASVYGLSRKQPKLLRRVLLKGVKDKVGDGIDMKHFKPDYNPWDERLCAVKSGDLFSAVRNGDVTMVTDHIDRFVPEGIKLKSGSTIKADIIVTATGLDLKFFGDIRIDVDGQKFDPTSKMNYKGVMLEDLPNIGFTFGYTNASWTLKADLTSEYICRLVKEMDRRKTPIVVPVNRDSTVKPGNFLDFQSGYIQRSLGKFPQMGSKAPWRLYQNYPRDLTMLRLGKMDDGILQFSKPRAASSPLRQAS